MLRVSEQEFKEYVSKQKWESKLTSSTEYRASKSRVDVVEYFAKTEVRVKVASHIKVIDKEPPTEVNIYLITG
jgi:hypothetical protein